MKDQQKVQTWLQQTFTIFKKHERVEHWALSIEHSTRDSIGKLKVQ